jgi:hypothetical protein
MVSIGLVHYSVSYPLDLYGGISVSYPLDLYEMRAKPSHVATGRIASASRLGSFRLADESLARSCEVLRGRELDAPFVCTVVGFTVGESVGPSSVPPV